MRYVKQNRCHLKKLARGLRFIWPDDQIRLPGNSAISYRRYQVGVRPLVALFHEICRPIATPATQGAFRFGLRLMALDGTVEDVPDTPENAAYFGRQTSERGVSAFPQARVVFLAECGRHVIVDAGLWPYHTAERVGGKRLLRSVEARMLVLWDRGFHDFDMFRAVKARGAEALGRLPAHVKPQPLRRLADGSYLAYLRPSAYRRRQAGERLVVRVIEYTLTDPALPGYQAWHRLVTTLVDPEQAPALEVVCVYHERWEAELVVDEVDTHQRLCARTLRSLKPVGVIQELYGLLLAHFAIRYLMHEAALQADVDPDRLSFVHAVSVIQDAIPEFQMVAPQQVERLFQRLLTDLTEGLLPPRRLRTNPCVVKRKMSRFLSSARTTITGLNPLSPLLTRSPLFERYWV
ncbi:MAG: IS4 family transposase [Chloroflexota bacterium]|nr:IS4 family transposase [Chloroflexota bacterium]